MDWKSIIADLTAAGVTQAEIAAQCHCAQTTVSDIGAGKTKRPNWSVGDKLLTLHKRKCRKPKATPSTQEA